MRKSTFIVFISTLTLTAFASIVFFSKFNLISELAFPIRRVFREKINYTKFQLDNADLKATIINEIPFLKDKENVGDFETVNSLREWVSTNIPQARDRSLLIINVMNVSAASQVSLKERLSMYRNGDAGAWCGATAYTLKQIYNLFGFESYTADSGDSPKLTHMVTLVRIEYQGEKVLSLQDAYFNYTIVDAQDSPLDYFNMLTLLKSKQLEQIKLKYGIEKLKLKLFSKQANLIDAPYKVSSEGNMIIKQKLPEMDFEEEGKIFFEKQGYSNNPLNIFLFPFSISDNDPNKSIYMLDKARDITEN